MMRILGLLLITCFFSCKDNANLGTTKQGGKPVYKDLKMEKGRTYSEIKVFDTRGQGKPVEHIVKLDRATNDPVSAAMYELVRSGLKYTGKAIKVEKIERNGDQWEIYFKSNRTPPKNLGKSGNYMVTKTLNYYIDHYNIYLDGEEIFTTNRKLMTKAQTDSLLREEQRVLLEDLDKQDAHNH